MPDDVSEYDWRCLGQKPQDHAILNQRSPAVGLPLIRVAAG
jgi:hypothetical protein